MLCAFVRSSGRDLMFVDKCVFIDGVHTYAGPDCPHGRETDEYGEVLPAGWTVQG